MDKNRFRIRKKRITFETRNTQISSCVCMCESRMSELNYDDDYLCLSRFQASSALKIERKKEKEVWEKIFKFLNKNITTSTRWMTSDFFFISSIQFIWWQLIFATTTPTTIKNNDWWPSSVEFYLIFFLANLTKSSTFKRK